jgi:hypothetical protein
MPTSYTTTVAVTGYVAGYTFGSQLDSLEIVSGSTSPYELPQPPSARASFLGLPTLYGVELTPDWWINKEVTFTIAPQGATGTVTWTGIVQGYTCSPVQTSSTDQIVELDLLGETSKLSTQIIQNDLVNPGGPANPRWDLFYTMLNNELRKLTWAEAPVGLTWSGVTTTWANYDQNITGILFANDNLGAVTLGLYSFDAAGTDMLSFVTTVWANKYKGWFWFDGSTVTLNAPASYTNYTAITSVDAETCVLWSSLNSAQSLNNILNSAMVVDGNSLTDQTYFDSTSYNQYGYRFQDFGTGYDQPATNQVSMLTDKINAYKQPNTYLQSLTIDLDALTHTTGEWQNFYKSTKPVRLPLTNIPDAYGGNHTYMVRGVQLNLTQKHAEATLLVVPSTIYNPS